MFTQRNYTHIKLTLNCGNSCKSGSLSTPKYIFILQGIAKNRSVDSSHNFTADWNWNSVCLSVC